MDISKLYNAIYKSLTDDTEIQSLLGIKTEGTEKQILLSKARKVQKRVKPPHVANAMPMISFYLDPKSGRDRNNLDVYNAGILFDVYTKNDVDKALKIASRLIAMYDGEIIPANDITTLESMLLTSYESLVDVADAYCFTLVFSFSVEIN